MAMAVDAPGMHDVGVSDRRGAARRTRAVGPVPSPHTMFEFMLQCPRNTAGRRLRYPTTVRISFSIAINSSAFSEFTVIEYSISARL